MQQTDGRIELKNEAKKAKEEDKKTESGNEKELS